jgi:hypothetical protein
VCSFLSAKAQYREKRQTRKAFNAALNGDVGSRIMLLKMRGDGLKFGDTCPLIVQIGNALPGCLPGR